MQQQENLTLTADDCFVGIETAMEAEWGAARVSAFFNRPWTKASAGAFLALVNNLLAIEKQNWPEKEKKEKPAKGNAKAENENDDEGDAAQRIWKRSCGFLIQMKANRRNAAKKWFEGASQQEQQKWSNAGAWEHVSDTEKDRLARYIQERFVSEDGYQFLDPADASITKRTWEKKLKADGAALTGELEKQFSWWVGLAPMYVSPDFSETNGGVAVGVQQMLDLQQVAENQNVQTPPPPPPFAPPLPPPAYLNFSEGRFEQSFVRPVVAAPPGLELH